MFVRIIFILIFQIGWLVNAIGQGFVERSDDFSFTWEYGIGEYGGGPSFVDFNLDGLDDVTIPSGFDEEMIFLQSDSTDFTFLTPLVSNLTEVKQVLWVDYDNDGDLDLYLTSRVLNALYKNTGDFVFEDITSTCGFNDPLKQTFCASWFDYDEDGLLDVLVSHRLSFMVGDLTLYRNLGNDQFEDVSIASGLEGFSSSPLAMATFDMNNDGLEDIYVVEDYEAGNLMFRNNGDAS